MTAIKAVLFDLHGVVTSSPWAAIASVAAASGRDHDELLRFMMGDYDADTDHAWHRLERGEIPITEYFTDLVERAKAEGFELDFSELRSFGQELQVNGAVVDTIRSLKQRGFKVALVTNNVKEASSGWRDLLDADELFDAVVDSSAVGVRKPNPAIFERALEMLGGLAPAEAVFLDDALGNVEGARRAGLTAILVEDPVDALAELNRLVEAA